MQYLMKSGVLYGPGGRLLCTLQKILFRTEKQIFTADGNLALEISICNTAADPNLQGDVRCHTYRIRDPQGTQIAAARPCYAPGEDPDTTGWPVCRMPRSDRAQLRLRDRDYLLLMRNTQNYILKDHLDSTVLQVMHRGIAGGWTIDTTLGEAPEVLCGLYVFCRYLEQENELLIV